MFDLIQKIKLPGHFTAFVVWKDGKEVGTIAKIEKDSAWNVTKGIGFAGKHVGNNYNKKEALALLGESL